MILEVIVMIEMEQMVRYVRVIQLFVLPTLAQVIIVGLDIPLLVRTPVKFPIVVMV